MLRSKCLSATFFFLEVPGKVLILMILQLVGILEASVAAATHVSINWFLHLVLTVWLNPCTTACAFPSVTVWYLTAV